MSGTAQKPRWSDEVREIRDDPDHGIRHNGNDHSQGRLSNCPRCAVDGLTEEIRALERAGKKLADAAERLERNPMANGLPRFRWPVVDAVADWRNLTEQEGS